MSPLDEVQALFPHARRSPGGLAILVGAHVRFIRGSSWYCEISMTNITLDGEGVSAKEALSYTRDRLRDTLERGQELLVQLNEVLK